MIAEKATYQRVMNEISSLAPQEQLELLEGIAALLRSTLSIHPKRNILELRGLGADIWRGVRGQQYINEERAAWDG